MTPDPTAPTANLPLPVAGSPLPASPSSAEAAAHAEHFATHHLQQDLGRHAVNSGVVTIAAQFGKFALNLGYTMVLARMLDPGDFGLVAMVLTFLGFLRVFQEAGLSTATVQREGITHDQVSNLFWINLGLGVCLTGLVAGLSPAIAWFYNNPALTNIGLALSATFLFSALSTQHQAILKRQMRFGTLAAIDLSAMSLAVLIAFALASAKVGYWALVGYQLAGPMATCILSWTFSRWRPRYPNRGVETKSLLRFGADLTAGGFIYSVARGSDTLLIGRFLGSVSVGLYSRAAAMLLRPLEQIISPIYAVSVPTLCLMQAEPARYKQSFLKLYHGVALVSFLATGCLFALARPLTLIVLGPKWELATDIFAGFTFVSLYYPLSTVSTWLFASQGRGRDWLWASSIVSTVTVCSFLIGLRYGPSGLAYVYSAACLLIELPVIYYTSGRSGPVTTRDLVLGFFRHLPVWLVVCAVTWLVRSLVDGEPPILQVILAAPSGFAAGLCFTMAFPPTRATASQFLQLLRNRRKMQQV